jgi:hypothetical protein
MKTDKHEQLINDKSYWRAETLTDLLVDEARQDEVKGGLTGTTGPGIYKSTNSGQTWTN